MNSTQAYVETRKVRQLPRLRAHSTTRRNLYRTPSLYLRGDRPTRYSSRTANPLPSRESLTHNAIEPPQPQQSKSSHSPSKPSPSNEDLASSLSAAAWNNLGIALASLEQYDDALNAFEQALNHDPSFDRAQSNARRMQDLVG